MERSLILGAIYLMFFFSGGAALTYEVVWLRSLSLIFGGSHLAVSTVLSVFMGGLALGSYTIGRLAHRIRRPLMLYGLLELGIALFAGIFMALAKLYPSIYALIASGRDDSLLTLSAIRVGFAVVALIVPTTLMGGTLPLLSSFVSTRPAELGRHLSFLYGFNTLGAMAGAGATGFYLLRFFSVSATVKLAVLTNVAIGLASILLQGRAAKLFRAGTSEVRTESVPVPEAETRTEPRAADRADLLHLLPRALVLWGIGVSGFCALGYEVLWTRILGLIFGPSVYAFATMLVAFLAGIGLGSAVHGLRARGGTAAGPSQVRNSAVEFGLVQVVIGITALLVTLGIRELPSASFRVQAHLSASGMSLFGARQLSNFIFSFCIMTIPTFFMGLAFPIAGKIHAARRSDVGRAVGEVLAYNTTGAILGAAASGFALVHFLGVERSLQVLTVVNIGFGLVIVTSALAAARALPWGVGTLTLGAILLLWLHPDLWRIWDRNYFAIYRNNQRSAFDTPEKIGIAMATSKVLYYAEGLEATVSSIEMFGGTQAFIIDGKVEASSHLEGMQCQYVLGHLPMLAHKDPKKILVIGLGSGMTLGATSVHPSVEDLTLVELEPKVLGVARTFERWNHRILDNPKLRIVFNDGRNFLLTTKNRYDIITADPIHPWARGASYLYTSEYFRLAADRLRPGGILCQWLPIYELTTKDLKSVTRTFSQHFPYTMIWLTHNDAELIGSDSPILFDEEELERRIAVPEIRSDLEQVMMGSATDFLSYFVMGTGGVRAFSRGGILNTDENLYLEFASPLSVSVPVMEGNVNGIADQIESLLPYLVPPKEEAAQEDQKRRWAAYREAAEVACRARALLLGGRTDDPRLAHWLDELERSYPGLAHIRFLREEQRKERGLIMGELRRIPLDLAGEKGAKVTVEISVVKIPIDSERAAVSLVDQAAKEMYGGATFQIVGGDARLDAFVEEVVAAIQGAYLEEAARGSGAAGAALPAREATLRRIREVISEKARASEGRDPASSS